MNTNTPAPAGVVSSTELGDSSEPRYSVELTAAQVQSLYMTLWRSRLGGKTAPETRPAFGWMEQPLVDIEAALEGLHKALHDRQFNGMNRQFFGNDSRGLKEVAWPSFPLRPGEESPNTTNEPRPGVGSI